MTLKYPDAQTIQGSTGAPQDTHYLDQGMTDGVNLMANTTIATMLRGITTDAPSTITGFHQQEAPECHHPTYKHLTLGLNHISKNAHSLPQPACSSTRRQNATTL